VLVVAPLLGLFAIVADEVVRFSKVAQPWAESLSRSDADSVFDAMPFVEHLRPYRDQLLPKLGELAGSLGSSAVNLVTGAARQAAEALLLLFVALYAMFFFLKDGRVVLDRMLYYLPLPAADEQRLVARFVSVARATIKGTLVIGALQGALGGLGFWVAGIDGTVLWATVMAVLSVIPGLGHALVWFPVVVYLGASGQWGACIGLLVWCAGVVGSVDNFLRPWLVGKDTELPDLLILVSTLGGLTLFGAVGLILGPIIAALFVTVWDLYGVAFQDFLPPTAPAPPSSAPLDGDREV
jgi:predicted PurR-regulated permease PerM